MDESIIIGDIECTGLDNHAKIIEIAWVEIDSQMEIIKEVGSLIDPEMPIPAHISAVTEITDEDVYEAPTIEEFFEYECKGCLQEPTVLIAHNAPFDIKFFKRHTDKLVGSMCTLRLARQYFPELENHKLGTIKHHFGFKRRDSHRALNDVKDTLDFVKILMKEADMTLPQLIEHSKKPIEVTHMPFGKHKGAPLASVPRSYTNWLFSQDGDIDPDLRAAFEKLGRC